MHRLIGYWDLYVANPSLATIFPTHHGLLHIHTLPAPHTFLPASDKFSTLRGLSSAISTGGCGENNLAFKCMRKRLIFETLHLDSEGGIGERRTTPSTNAIALDTSMHSHDLEHDAEKQRKASDTAVLHVDVQIEVGPEGNKAETSSVDIKVKKPKKVAFQSDRPELYDF
jgi:elongator complex protein 4